MDVRTTIIDVKNEEGKIEKRIFADLQALYESFYNELDNAERVNDLAASALQFKNFMKTLIMDSIQQAEEKAKARAEKEIREESEA